MKLRVLLNSKQIELTINRLCFELIENHSDFSNSVILGIQPRGINVSRRIVETLKKLKGIDNVQYGELDITFYRDDFRRRDIPLEATSTKIDFLIEDKNVILVDDVLYTGRTTRAALDALLDFGRPNSVEFLVLIDRRFSRDLPIQANYVGKTIDSIDSEKVIVNWKELHNKDQVLLNNVDKKA